MSTPYFHGDWHEQGDAYGVHYIPIYGPDNEEFCRVHHKVRSFEEFETSTETAAKLAQADQIVEALNLLHEYRDFWDGVSNPGEDHPRYDEYLANGEREVEEMALHGIEDRRDFPGADWDGTGESEYGLLPGDQ